jgi:hypothetical protein
MFSTLVHDATVFASSTQNPKKIIGTPNQLFRTKIFQKRVCLVPRKSVRAKSLYGSYPTEFAGSTPNPIKKLSERQVNQSE